MHRHIGGCRAGAKGKRHFPSLNFRFCPEGAACACWMNSPKAQQAGTSMLTGQNSHDTRILRIQDHGCQIARGQSFASPPSESCLALSCCPPRQRQANQSPPPWRRSLPACREGRGLSAPACQAALPKARHSIAVDRGRGALAPGRFRLHAPPRGISFPRLAAQAASLAR